MVAKRIVGAPTARVILPRHGQISAELLENRRTQQDSAARPDVTHARIGLQVSAPSACIGKIRSGIEGWLPETSAA